MDSMASREEPSTSYVICSLCSKRFGSNKFLNRHKKRIHKVFAVSSSRECRIICPMCEERKKLQSHQILRKHLEEKHGIGIELLTLQFFSISEYELWKQEQKIETTYSVQRTKQGNDHKAVYYICNRSDSKGYEAKYKKRQGKRGGTIKIQGMCPSQLICMLYQNGTVSVSFWKTHAGHENDLRRQHLSTSEKTIIVEKLKSGVSIDRILQDARKTEAPELQRINLINRENIIYMAKKHNIHKKRDPNKMVAATLKVQEWNANDIKIQNEEEIAQFLQEQSTKRASEEMNYQNSREVRWAHFKNWAESLNDDIFDKFMGNIQGAIRKADQGKHKVANKRKMDTPRNKASEGVDDGKEELISIFIE